MKYLWIVFLFFFFTEDLYSQNMLTKRQVFDWEVGDVTHRFDGIIMQTPPNRDRITIINKWFSADMQTVYYEYENDYYYSTVDYPSNIPVFTYYFYLYTDTMAFDQLDSTVLSYIKEEFWLFSVYDSLLTYSQYSDTLFNNLICFNYRFSFTPFGFPLWTGSLIEKVGVFDRNYYDPNSAPSIETGFNITYFKRGSYVWGTLDQTSQGLPNEEFSPSLKVYPNPANVYMNIELPNHDIYELEIIDFSGRVLYKEENVVSFTEIHISQIPKGIYLLSARSKNRLISRKISIY